MAIVEIMCPGCGEDMSIPARALLATIDLEHPREPLGGLSWVCLSCDDLVNADIEIADLLPLLSVGVLVVNDDFGIGPEDLLGTHGGSRPLENEPGGGSPPLHPPTSRSSGTCSTPTRGSSSSANPGAAGNARTLSVVDRPREVRRRPSRATRTVDRHLRTGPHGSAHPPDVDPVHVRGPLAG
jgi:hypothetical protein